MTDFLLSLKYSQNKRAIHIYSQPPTDYICVWGMRSLNKLVKRVSYILECPLDPIEVMGERKMLSKLKSFINNISHPLHEFVVSLSSSFSNWLVHPWCKESYHRSFLPIAVILFNCNTNIVQYGYTYIFCVFSLFIVLWLVLWSMQ